MKTTKPAKNSTPLLITDSRIGEPTHDEIALCAYLIWEQEERPQNHDVENWMQAETQLRQTRKQDASRV